MVIKQKIRFASVLLAAALVSLGVMEGHAQAKTDLAACYGETLDVSLRTIIEEDGKIIERKVFALPFPNAWLVDLGQQGMLDDHPCLDEPIEAKRVWGGFMDPRLGHADLAIPGLDGIRFRSLWLSSPGQQAAEGGEGRRVQLILSEGTEAGQGFVRRIGKNTDAIGGGWLFPETYLSPIETRVTMSCTGTCWVSYRIAPNLKLEYDIAVRDETEASPWIEIDKFVRAFVLGLMKGN
jgi:hypothetical protein